MNSALVLLVQLRIRAVSIVMDKSGLQETVLSQGVCVCCTRAEKITYLQKNLSITSTNLRITSAETQAH